MIRHCFMYSVCIFSRKTFTKKIQTIKSLKNVYFLSYLPFLYRTSH